jgi:hypothetical protein
MGEAMNEAELERVKLHNQMYLEYNKLVIENAMRAQRGLLLCHGGAITAILMSGKAWLLPYTLVFGCGAMLAVVSSCLGYWTNRCYMSSWGLYCAEETPGEAVQDTKKGWLYHRAAMLVAGVSVALFFVGLLAIGRTIFRA